MSILSSITTHILDLLFPREGLERDISTLTLSQLAQKLTIVEQGGVLSLFTYRDPLIRHMIWMLKYKGDRRVARLFGEVLGSYLMEEAADHAAFHPEERLYIVPLPLSRRRERERGFNQMVRVAEEMKRSGDFEIAPLLVRTRDTASQTSFKNRTERERNVVGAFAVTQGALQENATVILIDDVVTTGSTLREAHKALEDGGFTDVLCIALAH